MEILRPNQLVLQVWADATVASFIAGEVGSLAFDVNTNKLAFVTASGVSAEQSQ